MRLRTIFFGLCLLVALPVHAAVQITSLSPDSASPGADVTVTGGPFGTDIRVLIGEETVTPQAVEERRLTFALPNLPPGQYLLRLAEAGQVSPQPLLFRVVAPHPEISAITPTEFDQCTTDPPPRISIVGQGFAAKPSVLIDGVAVPIETASKGQIVLTPPPLAAGPHQIVVVNPSGIRSFPRGLLVNGTPEIYSVQVGSNDVTSYQLIIDGKNFLAASQLLVNGKRIPVGQGVSPAQDSAAINDCHTLVYRRHPYSSQPQPLALQVINPGGKQSTVVSIQAP